MFNKALHDVMDERIRQGYTEEHDDQHEDSQLAKAAACYANPMRVISFEYCIDEDLLNELPIGFPEDWDASWWKPTDRRSDLVKAAALLLAEIERLDRIKPEVAPEDEVVPPFVYWNAEHTNFFHAHSHRGMGDVFYQYWRNRVEDFPARPTIGTGE